jgi:hypothetical protein
MDTDENPKSKIRDPNEIRGPKAFTEEVTAKHAKYANRGTNTADFVCFAYFAVSLPLRAFLCASASRR